MTASACAKRSAIVIAVKILGALEGFLPSAVILAKLLAAKTAHGPKIAKKKINSYSDLYDRLLPPLAGSRRSSSGDASYGKTSDYRHSNQTTDFRLVFVITY